VSLLDNADIYFLKYLVSTIGYSCLTAFLSTGNTLRYHYHHHHHRRRRCSRRHHHRRRRHHHHHHHHPTVVFVWFIFKLMEKLASYCGLFYFPWLLDCNLWWRFFASLITNSLHG